MRYINSDFQTSRSGFCLIIILHTGIEEFIQCMKIFAVYATGHLIFCLLLHDEQHIVILLKITVILIRLIVFKVRKEKSFGQPDTRNILIVTKMLYKMYFEIYNIYSTCLYQSHWCFSQIKHAMSWFVNLSINRRVLVFFSMLVVFCKRPHHNVLHQIFISLGGFWTNMPLPSEITNQDID